MRGRRVVAAVAGCIVAGCSSSAATSGSGAGATSAPQPTRAPIVASAVTARQTPKVVRAVRRYNKPPYRAAISRPSTDNEYPFMGTTSIDALHYGLDLTWHASQRRLSGIATIAFRATRDESAVTLDLGQSLKVAKATLDRRRARTAHDGFGLTIATGPLRASSRHILVINYAGTPHGYQPPKQRSSLIGLGWNTGPAGQAWTLQEPFGAFTWYPVDDQPSDKAFYDITWHTQSDWSGISNGQLTADSVAGKVRTTHWMLDSPAAPYLVTAAIGPYREYNQTGPDNLPLSYWVRPQDRGGLRILRRTPTLLAWLQARLGRFPFASLGDVVVPVHSAVETQTMVTMGAPILASTDGPADLLHEYVHQWYGDEVTPSDWRDLWLNESFAYYLQLIWEASHGQTTTTQWRHMLDTDDQHLRTAYGPPADPKPADFAELNVYECGARMLDRLHSTLPATTFARLLRGWPRQHRFAIVDRGEWTRYLDRTSGRDLTGFAARWLTSASSPG